VDAGFRWMALKNVSIDVFFRYRFAQPSFSYGTFAGAGPFKLAPDYNIFSGHIGAAYHF